MKVRQHHIMMQKKYVNDLYTLDVAMFYSLFSMLRQIHASCPQYINNKLIYVNMSIPSSLSNVWNICLFL